MPTPLIYGGYLYVLGNAGVLDCCALGDGQQIYRTRTPDAGSGFDASPVASDGKLYLSSEDGELLVVTAGPKFGILARNGFGEPLMATPAISGGMLIVRSERHVWAIGYPAARRGIQRPPGGRWAWALANSDPSTRSINPIRVAGSGLVAEIIPWGSVFAFSSHGNPSCLDHFPVRPR